MLTAKKTSIHLPSPATGAQLSPAGRNIQIPDLVQTWELEPLLEHASEHVKVLSLDCFDTLLWRKVRHPFDVFFDLQSSEAFRARSFTAKQRAAAEAQARRMQAARKERFEVSLAEIYRAAFPDLTDPEVEAMASAELEAECAACFAFPPAVQLILAAKKRGLRVVIVSDTYFSESQLRVLLKSCLPGAAYDALEHVFCSSDHGYSKSNGLFDRVIETLREKPDRVLHLGDNPVADHGAARHKGISGVRLVQFQPVIEELLRLSASTGVLLAPECRNARGLPSVFHGLWSESELPPNGETSLAHLALGPVLYSFARFIKAEVRRLEAGGRRVKPVYLMRDAYLPQLVTEAVAPELGGTALSISRYAAYAASFTDEEAVLGYLARSAGSEKYDACLHQLLLSDKTKKGIVAKLKKSRHVARELVKQVRRPQVLAEILSASKAYRERLLRCFDQQVGLEAGDTLLFVDLGYEGTAQRCLGPILQSEKEVEVRGCYLLASSVSGWEKNRCGLLDPSFCDDRTLGALIAFVAVVEDLCTAHLGSVTDYEEDGTPIHGDVLISNEQFKRIEPVQQMTVDFARSAQHFFDRTGGEPGLEELRYCALSLLGRLLFLPTRAEIDYLEGFSLDLGLGTLDSFELFDREAGLEGLRRRGLFFMEKNQASLRMNYPIELRHAGLELSLTMMAHHRFGFELSQADLSQRRIAIEILALRGEESTGRVLQAEATHDGCFVLIIPVGACEYEIGLLFGKAFSWMQISSLELLRADTLGSDRESLTALDLLGDASWEGAKGHDNGIIELESPDSFAFISSSAHRENDTHFVVRAVFRPLAARAQVANDVRA